MDPILKDSLKLIGKAILIMPRATVLDLARKVAPNNQKVRSMRRKFYDDTVFPLLDAKDDVLERYEKEKEEKKTEN